MIPVIALSARNMEGLPGIKGGMASAVLTHDYLRRVQEAGGLPVMIPALGELSTEILERVDGFLLTGGEDVAPHRYGHEPSPHLGMVDRLRDAMELGLAAEALRRGMPVLGICRGMQVLNVALGGTLIQDLPTERPSDLIHRQHVPCTDGTHAVRLEAGSRLAQIAGEDRLIVNSFHHQAALEVPATLRAVAWSDDGVIEAVEGSASFLVGVQWHPECQRGDFTARLFVAFAEACRAYARRRSTPSVA